MATLWTEEEVNALRATSNYPDFVAASGSQKTYEAWEMKRRRAAKQDDALLEAAEDDLREWTELTAKDKDKERVAKALKAVEKPNLGAERVYPDVITFEPAFVDIEATNLKGNFGRILCVSVADMFGKVETFRFDDPLFRGQRLRDDVKLVVAVRDYLEQFDFLVGWNSKRYDIPFIDTRLLIWNERPLRKDIMHLDPMYKAGTFSLTLHSRRLDAVLKTFRVPVQKTALDPDIWIDAADGDTEAMDYVADHCEKDVLGLRYAFHILKPLIKVMHR